MKRTIKDSYGDDLEVDVTRRRTVGVSAKEGSAISSWFFTPDEARDLIKALRDAIKEAEAK